MEVDSKYPIREAADLQVDEALKACPPFFDCARNEWVLTRYVDVIAALREPALWPAAVRKNNNRKIPDEAAQQLLRAEVQKAFSSAQLVEWETRLDGIAPSLIQSLSVEGPVEIVSAFAQPWCLAAAGIVTGADSADYDRLLALSREVSDSAAEPLDEALQARASAANAELDRYLSDAPIPMAGPVFVALSRTLTCLLANGWLGLIERPEELRAWSHQKSVPKVVDEMLRLAGIPRALYRRALKDVAIGGLRVAEGERVALMVASANRDPERGPAQLSLGFGSHSCVGATLIRMAAAVATTAFIRHFAGARLCGETSWRGGSGFGWAESISVRL
jgi:cytochrome P450